jgi:cation transport ATPase
MSFASQLSNSVAFAVHSATYNPEAEAYAKKQEDALAAQEAELAKKAQEAEAAKERAKAAAEAAAAKQVEEQRRTFSLPRMIGRVFQYTFYAVMIAGLVLMSLASASYAVNLNLYRPWIQRIFYAFYGFFFSVISFPYIVFYRRWWLGHTIPSYGLLPIFEQGEASSFVHSYMPFLVFTADEHVKDTMEWEYRLESNKDPTKGGVLN